MISEQKLNNALYEILKHNKIAYTEQGWQLLYSELQKRFPVYNYVIEMESLKELSASDFAERKFPKITVSIIKGSK